MRLENSLRCISCSQKYDDDRKPVVGTCTHQICLRCTEKPVNATCPICDCLDAFKDKTINYRALETVKELEGKLQEHDLSTFVPTENELTSGQCQICREHSKKLRLCTECAEKDGLIRKFMGRWLLICENAAYEKEFLAIKRRAVCANCAIDGPHQEHHIEPFATALEWNFSKQEDFQQAMHGEPSLSGLLEYYERSHFYLEQTKQHNKNLCVLENCSSLIPEQQCRIEQKKRRMLAEIDEKEKMSERNRLLPLEQIDVIFYLEKLRNPAAPEVQKYREIRSKNTYTAKYLTPRDLTRIDGKILSRMDELKTAEALKSAQEANELNIVRERNAMLKLQLEDDEKLERYAAVRGDPKVSKDQIDKATYECLESAIKLTDAQIKCELEFQKLEMDRMVKRTMYIIFTKLCGLLKTVVF